jgi:hypothetical protein
MRDLQDEENKLREALRRYKSFLFKFPLCVSVIVLVALRCRFFFSGVHAPLNSADYLTGVSRKENIFALCALCVSSEAGGENRLSHTRIAKLGPSA